MVRAVGGRTAQVRAASAAASALDHLLAVATSPPARPGIATGEPGCYDVYRQAESQHDSGMAAATKCRSWRGEERMLLQQVNAQRQSLRSSCVGFAIARWRDRDKHKEWTYVVANSSFRYAIAREPHTGCENTALGRKGENTVVAHTRKIVHIARAGDVVPGARRARALALGCGAVRSPLMARGGVAQTPVNCSSTALRRKTSSLGVLGITTST